MTEDNGAHWSDITPEKSAGSNIASVFFLDESRGWVLLTSDAGNYRTRFQVAATANGGHTWSLAPVFTPKQYAEELHPGATWVNFADSEHGWVVLRKQTSSAFNMGRLWATQDGGNTWHELPQPPLGEPVHFANATDGWKDGDPASGVYHSRDGGNTWEGVDLQGPSSSVPTLAAYGQIKIIDAKHASIPVGFSPVTDQSQGTLVLFTTADGKNWKADRVLSMRDRYSEAALTAVMVDSMLITLPDLTLTTVAPDGTINRKRLSGLEEEAVVPEISFASPTSGWLRMSDGQLLSTTDGGETLILLEPGSAPRALPKLTPKLPRVTPRVTMRPIGAGPLIAPPMGADREVIEVATTAALHYTERLGSDKQQSFTGARMTTWWSKSPFFDVGFYAGGANYCYSTL